jgi:hypothetical protein
VDPVAATVAVVVLELFQPVATEPQMPEVTEEQVELSLLVVALLLAAVAVAVPLVHQLVVLVVPAAVALVVMQVPVIRLQEQPIPVAAAVAQEV